MMNTALGQSDLFSEGTKPVQLLIRSERIRFELSKNKCIRSGNDWSERPLVAILTNRVTERT